MVTNTEEKMSVERHKLTDQTINIDNNYGHSFWMEYENTDSLSTDEHIRWLGFAMDSLFTLFGDWMQPTSIDVDFSCCDPYVGWASLIPQGGDGSRTYLSPEASDFIKTNAQWTNSVFVPREDLIKEHILEDAIGHIRNGFACNYEEEYGDEVCFPGWGDIGFRSGKFLVDESVVQDGICEVTYNRGHMWFDYPVERTESGNWVSAPLNYDLEVPVRARVSHSGNKMSFSVQLIWSYFYDDHQPGKKHLKEAILRLEKMGWELKGGKDFL